MIQQQAIRTKEVHAIENIHDKAITRLGALDRNGAGEVMDLCQVNIFDIVAV
jgi:hypothetical protein